MDARIPNASTEWQLWYSDTFDRDLPPSLQSSGEDILRGLYELWRCTLQEGILDNGNASFSYFYLTWGKTPSTRVDVSVNPFHNSSLQKLRQWAHLMAQSQDHSEQTNSLLSRLAQLHYEFLQKSPRWHAASIDWSAEARELLARVHRMTGPQELFMEDNDEHSDRTA